MTDVPDTTPRPEPFPPESDPAGEPAEAEPTTSNRPLPITPDDPEVGLSQKGSGEDAIVRRETEI